MDKNKFGNYIREKRKEKNYTQKELADILLIDVTAVSKWERGVTFPDITLIPEICKALGVSEHELIESSNDTENRAMVIEAKQFKKIKNAVFYSFSAAYALAIVTCFIVNLAVEGCLSWFFPVLAGCVCGFTFVPGMLRFFNKCKICVFAVSTFLSMFLLFLCCSVYTGDYWVWVASSGVLLGYFALFYPIVFSRQKLFVRDEKYRKIKRFFLLTYCAGLYLFTVLLLICVNEYTKINMELAVRITSDGFLLMFIYGLCELLPVKRLAKLGADSIMTGVYFYLLNGELNSLLSHGTLRDFYRVDYSNWTMCSNGNTALIVLVSLIAAGVAMLCVSAAVKRDKN